MGAYTEILDFTFTANETSRTFSGLSITKDDFVKVVVTLNNSAGSTSNVSIFPNTTAGVSGNTTATNYHRQGIAGNGSSVFAFRVNDGTALGAPLSKVDLSISYLKISENGKYNLFRSSPDALDSTLLTVFNYVTSSNLTFTDAVTSLTFTSSVTNGIGTGSRIQIYKLAATKVADITVASNTTQVDISSLSIDKDSEYLLVSDVKNSLSSGAVYNLTPNDLTTLTGYHSQLIGGAGSSAFAFRTNNARILRGAANGIVLGYTHIKLSNIGAFTAQSYSNEDMGTTAPVALNDFMSSTAENITSITKLNVISSATNGIGSGSRFTLYKLYE